MNNERFRRAGLIDLAISGGIFLLLVYLDWRLFDRGVLSESPPNGDHRHLLRTLGIAVASGLALAGCVRMCSGTDAGARSPMPAWPRSFAGRLSAAGIPVITATVLTLVFSIAPRLFYRLVMEDGPVETLSALLAFLAGITAFMVWLHTRRNREAFHPAYRAFLGLLALACILIAGEEVSWLQRQVGFATPGSFGGNVQEEFNFHNFETDRVENAYYLWSFTLTVLAPFLRESSALVRSVPWLREMLPGRFVAFAGALAVGFNYEMWNIIPVQAMFFLTAGILIWFISHGRDAEGGRLLPAVVLVLLLVNQALSLAYGHKMVRSWDGTEVKELFMPYAILLYALELRTRAFCARSGCF